VMELDSEHGKAGSRGPRLAHQRRSIRPGPFRLGQYGLLLVVLAIADLPLLWIVLTAFKRDQEIVAFPPTIIPKEFTLDNFENLFLISPFSSYLTNSLTVAVATTVLTVALGTIAAYSFTRFRFRFLRGVGELSLFAYMVPPILVLVPIAQILTGLRLSNNLLALIVLYTATLLPFALWVLRSYFHGITVELEQAAMVDGCTRFGAFIRVVVPQAVPGLISTAVFTFNAAWSEYLFASTLMTTPKSLTLSPGLALLLDQTGVYSWGVLMAGSVIVVAPVVVLFVIAQKQLVGGLGEGAVKG
jgi:ABC-type glycerol-3-phosphate transport system permease component